MAMAKRERQRQPRLWVDSQQLVDGPSRPFDSRLNQFLGTHGFDDFAEPAANRSRKDTTATDC